MQQLWIYKYFKQQKEAKFNNLQRFYMKTQFYFINLYYKLFYQSLKTQLNYLQTVQRQQLTQHFMPLQSHSQHLTLHPDQYQCPLLKLQQPQSQHSNSSEQHTFKEMVDGRWNQDDNLCFAVFIHYRQDIFMSRHQRKSCKIFKIFSQYLQKRTAAQCRSHYQKLILKFKTIAKLKRHYRQKYGDIAFEQELCRLIQYCNQKTTIENKECPDRSAEKKEIGIQTDSNTVLLQQCQKHLLNRYALNQNSNLFSQNNYGHYYNQPLQNVNSWLQIIDRFYRSGQYYLN